MSTPTARIRHLAAPFAALLGAGAAALVLAGCAGPAGVALVQPDGLGREEQGLERLLLEPLVVAPPTVEEPPGAQSPWRRFYLTRSGRAVVSATWGT